MENLLLTLGVVLAIQLSSKPPTIVEVTCLEIEIHTIVHYLICGRLNEFKVPFSLIIILLKSENNFPPPLFLLIQLKFKY